MIPLLVAKMALSATSSIGEAAFDAGKKVIEVGIPLTKKAAQLSFTFIKGGLEAVNSENKHNVLSLSQPLDIVNNGLSVPLGYSENQFKTFEQNVTKDLNIIKGQNELLFLSNSISYFVESHLGRTGIDKSISYALQYDLIAVRNYFNKSRDLRFPGYLLHQCTSLAETVKQLNVFYSSILQNGKVPDFSEGFVSEELSKRYGANQRTSGLKSYIPYDQQLPYLREFAKEQNKNKSMLSKLFQENGEFNFAEISDVANEALYVLCEELIANEELEQKINYHLNNLPGNKLYIECP
jgi:hypothetical protein